jgi:hypothetical protein
MNETKITKCICVWFDEANGDSPAWIVSRDEIYSDGRTASTQTLHVYDPAEKGEAEVKAKQIGLEKNLAVYRNEEGCLPELIQAA